MSWPTTPLKRKADYLVWLKGCRDAGTRLARYRCPLRNCERLLWTETPPAGDTWDSLTTCAFCDGTFFRITRDDGQVLARVLPGKRERTVEKIQQEMLELLQHVGPLTQEELGIRLTIASQSKLRGAVAGLQRAKRIDCPFGDYYRIVGDKRRPSGLSPYSTKKLRQADAELAA